ncbi:MAG TPA: hypothetical protein H9671_03870 [Firmicutes bacterium]|nr:hypothetical protein [Bacillota bacterium]
MSKSELYLSLSTPATADEQNRLKTRLHGLNGVISVDIGTDARSLSICFDQAGISPGRIRERVETAGFGVDGQPASMQ